MYADSNYKIAIKILEPFKIHILGCGSALPTLKHNASSQLIEMRGKCFMVDCGEGAQMQFRRSHIHFSKLNAIFITHMHGDHCFGLMGLSLRWECSVEHLS